MSPTASQDRKAQGRTHTEDEWESVKHLFYHYYMENNLSLKEAAKLISTEYHFDATPRQWERRIAPEKWNFSKYTHRDDRLKQIRESGKSLLEVSHRGRRKSTASDGRPILNEDRNLRRFARREVSRTRPRARSVGTTSETSEASDQDMLDISAAPSPAVSEASFYSAEPIVATQFPRVDADDFNDPWKREPYEVSTGLSIEVSDTSLPNIHHDVPQITFSVHDGIEQMIPDSTSTSVAREPHMQFTQSDMTSTFPSYFPVHNADSYVSPPYNEAYIQSINDSSLPWNTPMNFSAVADRAAESFPRLTPDSSTFFDMMTLDESRNQGDVRIQLTTAEDESTSVANSTGAEMADGEPLPDFDNTYHDVHALLHDQHTKVLQMLSGCIKGCESVAENDENLRKVLLDHLRLLERGIQAQSKNAEPYDSRDLRYADEESSRNIRSTLQNIAVTQRRANRSIYDLSSRRKRQIEELKTKVDGM